MSNTQKILSENLSGETIDRVWSATSKSFTIDFQMGGSLTINVEGGKLVYNLYDVNGDIIPMK